MRMDDIVAALPQYEPITLAIDVTEFTGPDPDGNPVVYRYSELTIAEQFAALTNSEIIHADNPTWTASHCQAVATLAAAHRSPECSAPPGRLYALLCEKQPKLFALILEQFSAAFASTMDLPQAADEAKNASGTVSAE